MVKPEPAERVKRPSRRPRIGVLTVGEDGKPVLTFSTKQQGIVALTACGYTVAEVVAAVGTTASYVKDVRKAARKAGALLENFRDIHTARMVEQAHENLVELLEDEGLDPELRYKMSRDAVQPRPFVTGPQGVGGVPPTALAIGIKFELPAGMTAAPVMTGQIVGVPRTDQEPVDG